MESQKQLIMNTWLIMNIHDSIVGIHKHNSIMDIRNLKFTTMSIIQLWLSIIQNYGITEFKHIHDRQWSVRNVDVWKAQIDWLWISMIDFEHPWLIVGIHNSVMDMRNLIFMILNYHVYP